MMTVQSLLALHNCIISQMNGHVQDPVLLFHDTWLIIFVSLRRYQWYENKLRFCCWRNSLAGSQCYVYFVFAIVFSSSLNTSCSLSKKQSDCCFEFLSLYVFEKGYISKTTESAIAVTT